MKQIANNELAFHSLSFNDENGRLFEWQGDIYRAIPAHQAPLYQNLLEREVIEELVSNGLLIDTELTSLKVENYALVLKHRRIDFVAYPQEWCSQMLKDAALLHLDLCLSLDRHGLTTGDAHPLNILFDRCQPIFIDLGSIEEISPDQSELWLPYPQFCRYFVNPLRLMYRGRGRIARWLMRDYEQGILSSDVEALVERSPLSLLQKNSKDFLKSTLRGYIPDFIVPWARQIRDRRRSTINKSLSRRAFLEQVRQEIGDLNISANVSKSSIDTTTSPKESPPAKLRLVRSILADLQPASVLEIGNSNSDGSYARLAAQSSQVVFFTSEEKQAEQLYLRGKQDRLPILPLFIDFTSPSCDLSNAWFAPASDRLNCDLVLAIDLIDWLVFEQPQSFPFDRIVERLSIFSKRWLLTEFVPLQPSNQELSSNMAWIYSWYKLDNFIEALHREFSQVDTINYGSNNSVLLLCQK